MSSVNEKMTALAEAVRNKARRSGTLTIDGMTQAVSGLVVGNPSTKPLIVTPAKEQQSFSSSDLGENTYYSTVTVRPIPLEYIVTTDATATAWDILEGETAYANGREVTGLMKNNGSVVAKVSNIHNKWWGSSSGYYDSIEVGITPKSLEITPSEDTQTFYNVTDEEEDVFYNRVTVAPIPAGYILVTKKSLEVTPSKSEQVFNVKNEGENVFYDKVTVAPIPSEYITTADAAAGEGSILAGETAYVNGEKVTGVYAPVTRANVKYGVLFGFDQRVGNIVLPEVGEFTGDATAGASDIAEGKTAYVQGEKVTGTMPVKSAENYTPGTEDITISQGVYLAGDQVIKGDLALVPENINCGEEIFGVRGTFTKDATAGPNDILIGKTAYANGGKVIGSIPSMSYESYTPGRNDIIIPDGVYLSGPQTIKGDSDLTAENIKTGVSLFGVEGTFTYDATATAADIAEGKTAYVKGEKVRGTATGGGGGMEVYKCASLNVSDQTWSGCKAVMSDGAYSFEDTVTENLTFGSGYTPAPGFIYNSDATMLISNMWGGLPLPADYDIYATFATPAAEKGGLFTLERSSVDYGVTKNGVTGAEFNNGILSIPWNMSDDFTFSVRYKVLDAGESSYQGPLVRVGNDGTDTLYSMWVNMEWGWCMMHIEYGSGGTEGFDVDTNAHVYTLVKSGDELKLYVDGELRTTDNHICDVQERSHIYVGGMGNYYYANGHYSNLRIYSRALTADEVSDIVQQTDDN